MNADPVVKEHFPTAISQPEFVARLSETLAERGFESSTTIACVSACREEPATGLLRDIHTIWGKVFDFSSLAGMLLPGKTGMLKMQRCAEASRGSMRYVFIAFPHVALSARGEAGSYLRDELARPSPVCSALCALQKELALGILRWDFDPDDPEQSLLKQRLFRKLKYGQVPDLITLTKLAHSAVVEDLERLVGLTVATAPRDYAIVTGIQIHGPDRMDFISPGLLDVVVDGVRLALHPTFLDSPASPRERHAEARRQE